MNRKNVEILAPAGSWECLIAAIQAGADAVYIGGSRFGARAYANNLDEEQMLKAIDYVHLHGKKIYMTVNTLLKDSEMDELYDYLLPYYKHGLDAVIVQDVGVFEFVKYNFPEMPIHISTQMTITNEAGASYFKRLGAERVVPARELSLAEIKKMKQETQMEIECFVHGALCYCYSGQCLMSSMIGGRSGNRGQCAQPCRLPYSVNNGKSQDILSLKDLCTIDMIPELIEAGIDSFKIEGRMKQPEYVFTVVSMYRKYADLYFAVGKEKYKVSQEDKKKLQNVYKRRGYCEGYYKRHNGKNMISFKRPEDETDEINIPDAKNKEKINGKLILNEGESAKLSIVYKDLCVECEGAVVQTALKQPLDKERIDRQMRKTGTTEFSFEQLAIEIHGNIFMPMQALNELRRRAIEALEERILEVHRRKMPEKKFENAGVDFTESLKGFTALVQEKEQMTAVMESNLVSTIVVDASIAFEPEVLQIVKRAEKTFYCAMPYIFREKTILDFEKDYIKLSEIYHGIMVRNWESLEWLERKGYTKKVISDYNVYAFNSWSKTFLHNAGLAAYTAPVEENYKELRRLNISDGTLIVYGYQPMMISAGCIKKNTDGCVHQKEVSYLTDRYQKKFAVKNYCKYCYNILYNSAPLMLIQQKEEIEKLNPSSLRLDFSLESEKEVKEILSLYEDVFVMNKEIKMSGTDYTNGHFKRGVK